MTRIHISMQHGKKYENTIDQIRDSSIAQLHEAAKPSMIPHPVTVFEVQRTIPAGRWIASPRRDSKECSVFNAQQAGISKPRYWLHICKSSGYQEAFSCFVLLMLAHTHHFFATDD